MRKNKFQNLAEIFKIEKMEILEKIKKTFAAKKIVANLSDAARKNLIENFAENLEKNSAKILAANFLDAEKMRDDDPKKKRLILTEKKIFEIAAAARKIAALPDPAGKILHEHEISPNFFVKKISVPIGVVGMIFESRPNVTADAIAISVRAGNCAVLRGGSDADNSNRAIAEIFQKILIEKNLPPEIIFLLPPDRKFVPEFLAAEKFIDILIPRGSQNLINFVRKNSQIPTIETGAGVCHVFVEKSADEKSAAKICANAKISNPAVCNSLDTILVDEKIAEKFLPLLKNDFEKFSVQIFADEKSFQILKKNNFKFLHRAEKGDFGREFLDFACSIKIVENFDAAISHIEKFSSRHSETICSRDEILIEKFLKNVDAAAVFSNASTRFSDGEVFGLGAEIGISTQKLHARGPFALEKLVTEKWIARGRSEIRE